MPKDVLEFYKSLLSVPLFQGVTYNDLDGIVSSFHLRKEQCGKNTVLTTTDRTADILIIIIDGTINARTPSPDGRYAVEESFSAPMMLPLETVFARPTTYTTYTTIAASTMVRIRKRNIIDLLTFYEVIRTNVLHSLALAAQQANDRLWTPPGASLRQRIIQFFRQHTTTVKGSKTFYITLPVLAAELNSNDTYVSRELHMLAADELLILSRGMIMIPDMERLWHYVLRQEQDDRY